MRYFMHFGKTIAYATVQISKAVLTHLRGGRTGGEIRVRGTPLLAQGSGWYRIYGEVENRGNDILSTLNFISVRIKNMALKRLPVVQSSEHLFAFKEGFFKPEILSARRVLKVSYDTVRGHRVPRVVNRAYQASAGFAQYLAGMIDSLNKKAVSEQKLTALVAKFSH